MKKPIKCIIVYLLLTPLVAPMRQIITRKFSFELKYTKNQLQTTSQPNCKKCGSLTARNAVHDLTSKEFESPAKN